MKRILVTGGAGFIGCNFVRWLRRERPEWHVVNLDLLTYAGRGGNLDDLAGDDGYSFVRGDIRDPEHVRRAMAGCTAVVHLAAESHVDRSLEDAAPFLTTNVLGTQVLLEQAREHAVERFVMVSTDEVYGSLPLDRPDLKFTEGSPLAPSSPYSASKASADLLALAFCHTDGLSVTVTRSSNNFGPYQFPEKVIPLFVTNLLEGRRVPLYGDGLNVRDWIHVHDHCEALLSVLGRGRPGAVYNIGAEHERSNVELTHALLALTGQGEDMIERVTDRPGHDYVFLGDGIAPRSRVVRMTDQVEARGDARHAACVLRCPVPNREQAPTRRLLSFNLVRVACEQLEGEPLYADSGDVRRVSEWEA